MGLSKAARYFHTVRYLRPRQIIARVTFALRRVHADERPPPARRPVSGDFATPFEPAASMLGPDEFRFLNEKHRCHSAADWTSSSFSKLWRYNLHYFDDLNAAGQGERYEWHRRLVARWIAENPAGVGDGWEPYTLSRRIVNWIKWSLRGGELTAEMQHSLAAQVRWLRQRLEFHILGNHIFANAKALVFAGLFFDGDEARSWRDQGRSIIDVQLGEQVLPDGGHFELSPMYHAAFLEDVLDLANLQGVYELPVPSEWQFVIAKMRNWLAMMSHPDGNIAFFNDAAFGIAPNLAEIDAYCRRLNIALTKFDVGSVDRMPDSGYVRAHVGRACLLCDCAAVGPDYQPGHAHADSLSFEMSLDTERVFVNSGTSLYGTSEERLRQRGTAAHNCVVIDGQNSSEIWSGFRVARRARVVSSEVDASGPVRISSTHDGYMRLAGRNLHGRQWVLSSTELQINDRISGDLEGAEAFFHLHPDIEATQIAACDVALKTRLGGKLTIHFVGSASVEIESSSWHPRFGVSKASQLLRARFSGATLGTRISWQIVDS